MAKLIGLNDHKESERSITQMGLWSDNDEETKKFIARVEAWNAEFKEAPIGMNILDTKSGDEYCPRPHKKFTLQFKNRQIQERFWTR